MSLSSVNTATPKNINHMHQHPMMKHHAKTQTEPSVQSSQSRLTPTDTQKSMQNTGNHNEIQNEQGRADLSNPLTSAATQFNSQVAASRI